MKTVETLVALRSAAELFGHRGLHFEKIHGMTLAGTGEQIHRLRITRSAGAFALLREGPTVVLVSLAVDHDRPYRRGG